MTDPVDVLAYDLLLSHYVTVVRLMLIEMLSSYIIIILQSFDGFL